MKKDGPEQLATKRRRVKVSGEHGRLDKPDGCQRVAADETKRRRERHLGGWKCKWVDGRE